MRTEHAPVLGVLGRVPGQTARIPSGCLHMRVQYAVELLKMCQGCLSTILFMTRLWSHPVAVLRRNA